MSRSAVGVLLCCPFCGDRVREGHVHDYAVDRGLYPRDEEITDRVTYIAVVPFA